jgi:hypothetical protein
MFQENHEQAYHFVRELVHDEDLNPYYRSAEVGKAYLRSIGLFPDNPEAFCIPDFNLLLAVFFAQAYVFFNGDAAFLGEMLIAVPHEDLDKIRIKRLEIKKFMSDSCSFLYNEHETARYVTRLMQEADYDLARRRRDKKARKAAKKNT